MAINATTGAYLGDATDFVHKVVWSSGSSTQNLPGYVGGSHNYKRSVGSDIPNYHRKIREGELLPITNWDQWEIVNSFSDQTYQYKRWTGSAWDNSSSANNLGTGSYRADHLALDLSDQCFSHLTPEKLSSYMKLDEYGSDVVDRAVINLTVAKHDTLTSVAELAKTVNLFRGVGTRLGKLLENSKNPREWADLWLEGRYGWRTLKYDIESLDRAIKHIEGTSAFWRATAGSTAEISENLNYSYLNGRDDRTFATTVNGFANYRGIAVGQRKPPSFGFNIPKTAWELVPFSFVIDWFVNIGDTIDLVSGHMATNGQYVSGLGVRVDVGGSFELAGIDCTSNPTAPGWYQLNHALSSTFTGTYVRRLPFSVTFTPHLNLDLDALKVADLTALVIQQVSKGNSARRRR